MNNITALKRPLATDVLGRVVCANSRRLRDTYFVVVGVCLDGRYMLRSPSRRTVFDCPPDMVKLCDNVMYTSVGFVCRGMRVEIGDPLAVFEVHHLSFRFNLIYLTRFNSFNFPFAVRPAEITKILNPLKD